VNHQCFLTSTLNKGDYRPVGSATDTANSPKATSLSMSLKDGMNFLLSEMTTIVETVKVFGESFSTARTLVSLLPFLGFSMSMDFIVTT